VPHWDHRVTARVLLSLLCGIQGLATLVIDLNRTHATNPLWPGHARLHLVWQSMTVALVSIVALCLLWSPSALGLSSDQRFFLAALLASVSCFGFLLAFLGRRLYAGTLSDPNGIPPLHVSVAGRTFAFDMNLVAIVVALLSLAFLLALYMHERDPRHRNAVPIQLPPPYGASSTG
jgi:hypothetical protein